MTTTRSLNVALWAAQIVLAIVFASAGAFKAFTPGPVLLVKAPDLARLPLPLVRFIGIAELAAAAGFILPAWTGIAPMLTPIAAVCVMPIMAGAFFFDVEARQFSSLALVVVCSALAAFVARGRFTSAFTTKGERPWQQHSWLS